MRSSARRHGRSSDLGNRVPPPALFVVGALSQYLGAATAVVLFRQLPASSVAWLRVVTAAIALVLWRRAWTALPRNRNHWLLVGAFGTALAIMNLTFYLAIDRLPLGSAVAVEFLGPVVVATLGSRGRRELGALALAVVGVLLVSGASLGGSTGLGVLFALLAAAFWAVYIRLGALVADRGDGITSLATGMIIGAAVIAPFTVPGALPAFGDARLIGACVAVGVLSSTIPYVLDQVVLRRISAARFALLEALLPVTAAVIGAITLHQLPSVAAAVGIVAVGTAVALATGSPAADGRQPMGG